LIVQNGGGKPMQSIRAGEKECDGDQKTRDAIGFIKRDMTVGGDGAEKRFARDHAHQEELEGGISCKDFPSERRAKKYRSPNMGQRF